MKAETVRKHKRAPQWLIDEVRVLSKTHTLRDAAKKLGITYDRITGICAYRGISYAKWVVDVDLNDVGIICELRKHGLPYREIAEKFDLLEMEVKQIIANADEIVKSFSMPRGFAATKAKAEISKKLSKAGVRICVIVGISGMSDSRIYDYTKDVR